MEGTAPATILSRSKLEEINARDRIFTEMSKDANRKTHDEFVAKSRQNILSCQHKIVYVRERLASLDIADCGQQEHLKAKKNAADEKNMDTVHSACENKAKSPAKSSEVSWRREKKQLIKQRSSSFEDPSYLKNKTKLNHVKSLSRRHSDTLMCTPFSRYNTGPFLPETGQDIPTKKQISPKRHPKLDVLPRLAIRRNSDPVTERFEKPRAHSVEKISDDNSKEMGDMYHGSLFRVLRHSLGALEARPRSCIGNVWQKSNDVFSDSLSNVQTHKLVRQPQPPSTPRELSRSNTVTSHQLNLIHQNHQALVGRQLCRPLSFRHRTTTI